MGRRSKNSVITRLQGSLDDCRNQLAMANQALANNPGHNQQQVLQQNIAALERQIQQLEQDLQRIQQQ